MSKRQSIFSFFYFFLLCNLCFFILQIALIYTQNDNFISAIKLPLSIYLELIATLGIHISLYVFLSLIQTVLLLSVLKRSWHYFTAEQWSIIIWTLFACTILCANAYFFPLSVFSTLFSPPIPPPLIFILFLCSTTLVSLLFINSLLFPRNLQGFCIGLFIIFISMIFTHHLKPARQNFHEQPNVIMLGIDSLSPENIHEDNMPFLYQLINQSTQYTNTISPLARTYPAWASMLTGLYAEHHHAEENLIPKKYINTKASILWRLDSLGYETIYATDDRRFNSIDKDFGFKQIIGPKLGVNDVFLGTFNDFPLSNLIINSNISAWLFPYNYINRASFYSYYPASFNNQLEHELTQIPVDKPVFLAIHFTLPHWPYAWAVSSPEELNNEFSIDKRDHLYLSALQAVDKQFADLFRFLKKGRFFHNSLVIILSDHGETLFYPGSRQTNYQNYRGILPSKFAQYLKTKTDTVLNKSAGHGSDILSPKQYHSLLAFRIYEQGKLITINNKITARVALIDVAPTILNFLHQDDLQPMDGISLLPALFNTHYVLPERVFFVESGMFPNQKLSKEKAIAIGKEFYTVNPLSGELEIKADKFSYFDHQKLYGIISGDWILALYPDDKTYIAIIQNLSTGEWTDDLHSEFASKTPANQLYKQLTSFFGKKLFLPLPGS